MCGSSKPAPLPPPPPPPPAPPAPMMSPSDLSKNDSAGASAKQRAAGKRSLKIDLTGPAASGDATGLTIPS